MKFTQQEIDYISAGHSPHGECGLKSDVRTAFHRMNCHSPHGECGLKYGGDQGVLRQIGSLPAWGVRVEIAYWALTGNYNASLPAWGVRVEMRT